MSASSHAGTELGWKLIGTLRHDNAARPALHDKLQEIIAEDDPEKLWSFCFALQRAIQQQAFVRSAA